MAFVNSDDKWKVKYMTLAIKMADERQTGETLKVIKLICKKIVKGKDIATIADELEEDEDFVSKVVSVAADFAPDYNAEKIYRAIF